MLQTYGSYHRAQHKHGEHWTIIGLQSELKYGHSDIAEWLETQSDLEAAWDNCNRADRMFIILEEINAEELEVIRSTHNASGRQIYFDMFAMVFDDTTGETFAERVNAKVPSFIKDAFFEKHNDEPHALAAFPSEVRDFFNSSDATAQYEAWDLDIMHAVMKDSLFEVLNYLARAKAFHAMNIQYLSMRRPDYEDTNKVYIKHMEAIHAEQANIIRRYVPVVNSWFNPVNDAEKEHGDDES